LPIYKGSKAKERREKRDNVSYIYTRAPSHVVLPDPGSGRLRGLAIKVR